MATVERVRRTAASVHRFLDGTEVLVSYNTPVAGWKAGIGYFKTGDFWSVTTSRHINAYLRERTLWEVKVLPQEEVREIYEQHEQH